MKRSLCSRAWYTQEEELLASVSFQVYLILITQEFHISYTVRYNMPEMKSQIKSSSSSTTPPFVSREQEMLALNAALQAALAGHGQVRLIKGEAGSGKTTLINEFVRQAQQRQPNLVAAVGVCDSQVSIGDLYLPFREIFNTLTGNLDKTLAQRTTHMKVNQPLPVIASYVLDLLLECGPEIIETFIPAAKLIGKIGVQLLKKADLADKLEKLKQRKTFTPEKLDPNKIFEQYTSTLQALSARFPLLLVIDDLQWLDDGSAGLFFHLTRRLAQSSILLLGLYRPTENIPRPDASTHPLTAILPEIGRQWGDIELDLDQINAANGRQFVDRLLDTEPNLLSIEFRNALFQQTQGNPLFTIELLRDMQTRGYLSQDAQGRWIENPTLQWQNLPAKVEQVIKSRVKQLTKPLFELLRDASVEGPDFTAQVLMRVAEVSEDVVSEQICDELDERYRLVVEGGQIELPAQRLHRFRFVHVLFQKYLYDGLKGMQRQSRHLKVGEALEQLYAGHTDVIVVQLAHHFEQAGQREKALQYLLQAGVRAQNSHVYSEAIAYLQKALLIAQELPGWDSRPECRQTHATLGELLTVTGKHADARLHLQTAHKLTVSVGDSEATATICRWLARSYENAGDYPPALEWIQRGLAALAGRETAETVQLRLLGSLIYLRRGEVEVALEQAQIALPLAQGLGEPHALGRTYLLLAVLTLQRGQKQRSVEMAQRGLDYYTQADDLAGQATAHNQIANARFNMGQWSAAAESYTRARDTFQRIGDLYNRAFTENNLGEIALNQGRLEDALTAYWEALRLLEQIGSSPYVLGVLHNNLGAVYVRRGELAAAREHLQASLTRFELAASRDILPEVSRHLAEIAWQEGSMSEAEAEAQRSLALARELQAENEAGITLRLLGELALARGEHSAAAARFRESLAILLKLGETYQAARTRLTLARLALAVGRPADARAELDACEPVFAQLEAVPDLAAAREVRSQMEN